MSKTQEKRLIQDDMIIGDILNRYPDAAQIMQDFGLHCTSCSVNTMEPVKMGAMSHGLPEDVVDSMMDALNDLALARSKAAADGLYVTANAAQKIMEFSEMEDKLGYALRITAKDNAGMEPAYAMDFEEKPGKDDKVFEFHGVKVFLDPESTKNLTGAEVDYLETSFGNGFKIFNPQFTGKSCSCGNNGGCGCGSGSSEGGCGCH